MSDLPPLPPRPEDGHKGTFGTLLIVGGSLQMIGAPMLAARSALRAGCGLVRVAMPQAVLPAALSLLPEATGLGFQLDEDDPKRLADALDRCDAATVGPGLGDEPQADALLDVLLDSDLPLVIDADGLNHLARRKAWRKRAAPTVLTPHPGEMKRLLAHLPNWDDVPNNGEARQRLAKDAAEMFGCVVLLKGQRTVIATQGRVHTNATGDVTLAKAGSGDVLAGLIGSLLAQGMTAFDAAVCGAHYHGLAGERVGRAMTKRGGLAHEVADALPHVMEVPE